MCFYASAVIENDVYHLEDQDLSFLHTYEMDVAYSHVAWIDEFYLSEEMHFPYFSSELIIQRFLYMYFTLSSK